MFLALSILFSSVINLIFKYFDKYKIDNQQAIAVNYWVCVFTGIAVSDVGEHLNMGIYQHPWAQFTLGLGALFILVFFGMAVTAQKFGISVSVIAAKMGVIFPVLYAFIILKDVAGYQLIIGILISLVGVYLVSRKERSAVAIKSTFWFLLLPFVVLIGSGFIDLSLKWIEIRLDGVPASVPTILIFFSAALVGSIITVFRLISGRSKLKLKNILGGVLLGIPNYFSIYFLFKALQSNLFQTSQVYPLNNIGVVLLSTLLSILIFKEHLSRKNRIGVALAILAIVLISWPI